MNELVRRGADGDCTKTRAAIEAAIRADRRESLELLLVAGANPNRGAGEFPDYVRTFSAAVEGRVFFGRSLDITRVLLAHGADTEQRDEYRWNPRTERADDTGLPYTRCEIDLRRATPLIAATVAGDIALVRELLASKADLMANDADGKTALDYARTRSDPEMISALQRGRPTGSANAPLQRTSGSIRPC